MSGVIVIGYNRVAYTATTALIGNTDLYLNQEQTNSPLTVTIHGTDALGTDIAGGTLQIVGGRGTGTGTGGNIVFKTASSGLTGSSLNALTTAMTITEQRFVGIGDDLPSTKLDVDGDLAHRATSPASFSTNQNNFSTAGTSFIRLNNTAGVTVNLTGFANGSDGKRLIVANVGANNIDLKHEDVNSSEENRLVIYNTSISSTGNYTLVPDDVVEFIYDSAITRWRKIN